MAADAQVRDSVLEKLGSIEGITSKSMFGGYGIFAGGYMFALVSGNALFFKADDSNTAAFEAAGSKPYGRMPYYRVPEEVLSESARLLEWANTSIAIARKSPKKK